MKVTSIEVSAGRTFGHPYEQFSNLRPSVTLKATLAEGDDSGKCVKELQKQAERLVEEQKWSLLETLRQEYESGRDDDIPY